VAPHPAALRRSGAAFLEPPGACGLDAHGLTGYTFGMKTAISLPDDVFRGAEVLAKRLRMSRSELYAKAVSEFLFRHSPDEVTASFDQVCAELKHEPDPAFQRAARKVLEDSEW
jgi:hypothetical protein